MTNFTQTPLAATLEHAPLRLLCVAAREPSWTMLATRMSLDYAAELRIVWVADAKAALGELRSTAFDAVLYGEARASWSASSPALLDFLSAVHTWDAAAAVLVLLDWPDERLQAELFRRDADVCISPQLWESPALAAAVAATLRRRQRAQELQRLSIAHQRRLARDQADAASMLHLQQELLRGLTDTTSGLSEGPASRPSTSEAVGNLNRQAGASESPGLWQTRYDDLLKASILSGANRLTSEIVRFVDDLIESDAAPADVLALHIERVRALADGWGGRASQHLVSRADLLVLEVLAQLGEHYRQRCESVG